MRARAVPEVTRRAPNWTTPVDQCDVVAQARLTEFRERADVWLDALDGDEENSVSAQILTMMGDDAKWRALNEARRFAVDRDDVATSSIVGSLLDRGYVAGQVIAIGRLLEAGNRRNPAKQVNSIRRLVDEISEHRGLLTREVYIARDGLPYSYEKVREKYPLSSDGGATWMNDGQQDWIMAQLLHQQFDRLSDKTAADRTRDDVIADVTFDRMAASLTDPVFADILELRHKSIAHAADRFSRAQAANLRKGMKLDDFARAQYLLIGLYQAISVGLLYQAWLSSPLATPQHNIFENLEKPIITEADLGSLQDFWQRHTNEREDWMSDAYREIIPS